MPETWFDELRPAEHHQLAAAANERTLDRLFALLPWLANAAEAP